MMILNNLKNGLLIVSVFSIGLLSSCNKSGSKDNVQNTSSSDSIVSSKTDSTNTTKADSTQTTTAPVAENEKASVHTVTIDNMKFTPETITVNKGDKVTFINKDIVAHNATEVNKVWHSPDLQNGQSWTFIPEKTSDYYCTIHLVMKGKIIVK